MTMKQWIASVKRDAQNSDWTTWGEIKSDFENTLRVFGSQDGLNTVLDWRKEQGDVGQDWYVEFTATVEGQIGGAVLAYNLQADYVNLTIPIWLNETNEAVEGKSAVEAMEALSDLIDAKAATLRPYIDVCEAAI
jgi:hypothetical protein